MAYNEILKHQLANIEKYVTAPLIKEAKARIEKKWNDPKFHSYYHYFRDRGCTHDIAETKAEEMCK